MPSASRSWEKYEPWSRFQGQAISSVNAQIRTHFRRNFGCAQVSFVALLTFSNRTFSWRTSGRISLDNQGFPRHSSVYQELKNRLESHLRDVLKAKYDLTVENIPLETPPDLKF